MTDTKTEINQTLHRLLDRGCWHECEYGKKGALVFSCKHCPETSLDVITNPEYTEDIRAAFSAQAEVVEKVGGAVYFKRLCLVVCPPDEYMDYVPWMVATASAEQRTAAMVAALTNGETK